MSVLQPLARCQSKTSFDDNRNMSGSGAGDGAQQMPSERVIRLIRSCRRGEMKLSVNTNTNSGRRVERSSMELSKSN